MVESKDLIDTKGEASSPKLCIEGYVQTSKNQKYVFGSQ